MFPRPGAAFLNILLLAGFIPIFPQTAAAEKDFPFSLADDVRGMSETAPLLVLGWGAVTSATATILENPDGHRGFMGGGGFLHRASVTCDHAMGLPLLGASVLTWCAGALANDAETEESGMMLSEGLLLTYGTVGILKTAVGRERPDGSNNRSFPSAHAAGTACVAAILWNRYGKAAGIPASAIAAFTAASRVHLGRHFPSDVIAGSSLGLAVGLAVAATRDGDAAPAALPSLGLAWNSHNGFHVYSAYEKQAR